MDNSPSRSMSSSPTTSTEASGARGPILRDALSDALNLAEQAQPTSPASPVPPTEPTHTATEPESRLETKPSLIVPPVDAASTYLVDSEGEETVKQLSASVDSDISSPATEDASSHASNTHTLPNREDACCQEFDVGHRIFAVAWNPSGREVAVGTDDPDQYRPKSPYRHRVRRCSSELQTVWEAKDEPAHSSLLFRPLRFANREWERQAFVGDDRPPEYVDYEGEVRSLAFSRDGRYLAVAAINGSMVVYERKTMRLIFHQGSKGTNEEMLSVRFSPKRNILAAGSSSGVLSLYDVSARDGEIRMLHTVKHLGAVRAIDFSPASDSLALVGDDEKFRGGRLSLYALNNGKTRFVQGIPFKSKMRCVAFNPVRNMLAASGDEGVMHVYELPSFDVMHRIHFVGGIRALDFSVDGERCVTGGNLTEGHPNSYGVTVLDVTSWNILHCFEHGNSVSSVSFSPGGEQVAAGDANHKLVVYDLRSRPHGTSLDAFRALSLIGGVAFSSDGDYIAVGSTDCMISVYGLTRDAVQRRSVAFPSNRNVRMPISELDRGLSPCKHSMLGSHKLAWQVEAEARVRAVVFSPSNRRELAVATDTGLFLYVIGSYGDQGSARAVMLGDAVRMNAVSFAPTGAHIAAGGNDNTVTILCCKSQSNVASFIHEGRVRAMAWSPCGTRLVAGGNDSRVTLYDMTAMCKISSFRMHGNLRSLSWSPDSSLVASGGDDKLVCVRNIETNNIVRTVKTSDKINCVCFSPCGNMLAVGTNTLATVWDLRENSLGNSENVALPCSHMCTDEVHYMCFTPCGRGLAVGAGVNVGITDAWHGTGKMAPHPNATLHLAKTYPDSARRVMQQFPYAANVCDESGSTPLHLAALSNSADAIRLLVSEQPVRCCLLQNFNGVTPLGVALEMKYEGCVRALIPALTHVISPINRVHVVECDLVLLITSYAELATQLFNSMGLDSSGAVVLGSGGGQDGHYRPTRAALRRLDLKSLKGMVIAGSSANQGPSEFSWSTRQKRKRYGSKVCVVESQNAWLMWDKFCAMLAGSNAYMDVEVEPVVLGLYAVAHDREFLDAICACNYSPLMETECVRILLEHMWRSRHFKATLLQLVMYIVLLSCFVYWMAYVRSHPRAHVMVAAIFTVVLEVLFLIFEIMQLKSPEHVSTEVGETLRLTKRPTNIVVETRSRKGSAQRDSDKSWCRRCCSKLSCIRLHAGKYVSASWNAVDMLSALLVLYLLIVWMATDAAPNRALCAVASLLSFIRLIFFLKMFRKLAAHVALLVHVVRDMSPFLLVLTITVMGFSTAFHALDDGDEFNSQVMMFYVTLGRTVFGGVPEPEEMEGTDFTKFLWVVTFMMVLVVMLNLLIAIISDTFDHVQEKEAAQFQLERARLIRDNNAVLDALNIWPEKRCPWLHVLRPRGVGSSANSDSWSGRIRTLKRHQEQMHTAIVNEVRDRNLALETQVRALEHALRQQQTTFEQRVGHILDKLHDVRQVDR